jgi:hypothetical protein
MAPLLMLAAGREPLDLGQPVSASEMTALLVGVVTSRSRVGW